MKRFLQSLLYTMLFTAFMSSCDQEFEVDLDQIPIESELKRFDRAFYGTDTANFKAEIEALKDDFGPFFSDQQELIFFRNQRLDEQNQRLFEISEQQFGDLEEWKVSLNNMLKRYYYYFGSEDTIETYTYISSLDFNYPVVFAKPYLFIELDMYLGEKGKEFYKFLPEYLQFHHQPAFMLRDAAYEIAKAQVPPPAEPATLLDAMIYHGKVLKLTERLLGKVSEDVLLVYPQKKHQFAQAHEKDMWIYFIENQLLFKTDQEVQRRFIEVAPFSKFRTKTDPETPGRIGRWFGYRIVDAFLNENSNLTLQDLLNERDSRKILKLSRYKP